MKHIKSTDIISRVFTKMRGSYAQKQKFTAHSAIFEYQTEDELLQRLINYMLQTFLAGTIERDLGCSNGELIEGVQVEEIEYEEIRKLAFFSEYSGHGNKQHIICQEYFILNDQYTICFELPLYDDEMSGFADIIRYKNGRIEILDLKPNAAKENKNKTGTQLRKYRKLLAFQLKCSEDMIDTYYFDEENVFKVL